MFYRNTFPEFLEAISIGPNPAFLENNTTFCEFASGFPQEVELMYDWKAVKRSSNPLNALRNFTKKFIIYGPDLDVQTLKFFVQKVNVFPEYYGNTVKDEVGNAFETAKILIKPDQPEIIEPTVFITNNTSIHTDQNFLNKLAAMLKSCKAPCNYFKPTSSSIGTLADFGRALSDSASMLCDTGSDLLHAPTNIATGLMNKIKPQVKSEFFKLKILSENLYKNGVKPFFSKADRARVQADVANGQSPDSTFARLPLTGDTQSYFTTSSIHSQIQSKIKEHLGDCFRVFEYGQRYNPYDPIMNASYAKRKYMGVKNGNVKSLVDTLGALAPAQYASENTYKNALDVPTDNDYYRSHDDSPKAPTYHTYDGPSKGAEAVITAGGSTSFSPTAATQTQAGAGLENVPTNGKIYDFGFGEVKITAYGYAMDECPDTGSEIGLGHKSNLIIPLKSIAVAPETIKSGMVKSGDILILTCTDKAGNTWIERRQVGDTSGPGLLHNKEGNFKFLIDEFLPTKTGSKMLAAVKKSYSNLKISMQIADTKEDLPKWNPQEASQFAPMFICRTDWERVKKHGRPKFASYVNKMDSEYIKYVKWSPDEQLKMSIVNNPGC